MREGAVTSAAGAAAQARALSVMKKGEGGGGGAGSAAAREAAVARAAAAEAAGGGAPADLRGQLHKKSPRGPVYQQRTVFLRGGNMEYITGEGQLRAVPLSSVCAPGCMRGRNGGAPDAAARG